MKLWNLNGVTKYWQKLHKWQANFKNHNKNELSDKVVTQIKWNTKFRQMSLEWQNYDKKGVTKSWQMSFERRKKTTEEENHEKFKN